jgi:exopolyphosphatase/guanosine-5'-triphosphate,3'-diphosphate pyrophosphatase
VAAVTSFAPARLTADEERSLERVLETTSWQLAHVRHVQLISAWLFEVLRPYHGLGDVEERLLLAGALLHDVGYPTDPPDHHKASARVVRTHLGEPFEEGEVDLIALIARYHRRSPPKLKHRRYAALDEAGRRLLCWLAGILRIADGLDRSHAEAVRSVSAVRVEGRLEIVAEGARAEDLHGAMRKRDLLERILGMAVVVRAA